MKYSDIMESILSINQSPDLFTTTAFVLGTFSFILAATWFYSWLHSFPARPNTGREPPLVPYYLPYLGHLFQFISNPGGLVQRCR